MDDYEVTAFHEEAHSRTELRKYPDRWVAVYLRHRIGGGWVVDNLVTIPVAPSGEEA